ncbi:hypothetical protein [Deinococcus fonticola]|uniref:hypothetical protein n=1 Tax=Deinococcus fonticola TaxID=2528713 RepID=UPI001F0DC837|nr:hypothetical protein [Deinococcus fonticola]
MAQPKKKKAPPRNAPPRTNSPAAPPVAAPLPAELLTSPATFGARLARANTVAWQYWPAPVMAALLAGLAYALLMRPGLNLAAAEALKAAGESGALAPTVLSHIANAFGTFFLTTLTFLTMWGLGRVGIRSPQAKVAEVYSATFTLLVPLFLLVILLILLTPASAWALSPAEISAAKGQLVDLQRAALHVASRTPAALAFVGVTLLGTLAQFALAYPALKATAGSRAMRGVLLPLLPALLIQFLGVAPLIFAR